MNTITRLTLSREQNKAPEKHFLDLQKLRHHVHKLSAPSSSSPKIKVPDKNALPGRDPKVGLVEVLPVSKSLLLAASRSLFRAMVKRKQLLESTEEKGAFPYRNVPSRRSGPGAGLVLAQPKEGEAGDQHAR